MEIFIAFGLGAGIFLLGLEVGIRIGKNGRRTEGHEGLQKPPRQVTQERTREEEITFGSGSLKPMRVKDREEERLHGNERKRIAELFGKDNEVQ